jgi:DNA-binding LacI/PurR family transcriptional regulator
MLADNAVPHINVGVYRPDRPYPCVGANNEAAAYRAALAAGHEPGVFRQASSVTRIE